MELSVNGIAKAYEVNIRHVEHFINFRKNQDIDSQVDMMSHILGYNVCINLVGFINDVDALIESEDV